MTHDSIVNRVVFSPDGKYITSGSDDHTARVWETFTGKEIARITHENKVTSIAFSLDGRYIVSGSLDGTARVWIYHPDDLTAEACSRLNHNLTRAQWEQYIGFALSYEAICPRLPINP